MRDTIRTKVAIGLIFLATAMGLLFQNCAEGKFIDPDTRHTAIAMGYCQECKDEAGSGLSCRKDTESAFSSCTYEACNPGLLMQGRSCSLVVCTAGSVANCEVGHGEGRRICNAGGVGYGPCTAIECESGFKLSDNNTCIKVEGEPDPVDVTTTTTTSSTTTTMPGEEESTTTSTSSSTTTSTTTTTTTTLTPTDPICVPGGHRDCSTESTYGSEVCNGNGNAYGICKWGDCKPGHSQDGGVCVPQSCEPSSVTPCTVGAGYGYKTCNSIGSSWGACELNGCQQGYYLKDGVCTVQACVPGSEAVCEFNHGSGVKICNSQGMDYGACQLLACQTGYLLQDNQCLEQSCQPGSIVACVGESGTGLKHCNSNGMGHGACQLNNCDAGFKLKGAQCVSEDSCEDGETVACTHQNGTGLRTCNTSNHKFGPCFIDACNPGYELVSQNGNACKKIK
jgi:hypothetical protein